MKRRFMKRFRVCRRCRCIDTVLNVEVLLFVICILKLYRGVSFGCMVFFCSKAIFSAASSQSLCWLSPYAPGK